MSALDRNHPTALVKNPARDVAEISARLAACRAEVASRRRDERTG
jgi:hypothetical protein